MVPTSPHEQQDLHFINRCLPAFDAQDPVAVVQVEIDPALRKIPLQKEGNHPGDFPVGYIGLEYLYNFHNTILDNEDVSPLENVKDARLDDAVPEVGACIR